MVAAQTAFDQPAVLCSFQHYTSNQLATADAHGRVMIHLLTDTGEGIVVNALLDLNLGSLQGLLLADSPLQYVRTITS